MSDVNTRWAERCDEGDLRVEKILHLGTMSGNGALEDDMFDALVEAADSIGASIGMTDDEFLAAAYEDATVGTAAGWRARRDAMTEMVASYQLYGWLVEAAHPSWTRLSDNAMNVSWGSYYSKWFYDDTYEACVEQALAWAEEEYERAKATA